MLNTRPQLLTKVIARRIRSCIYLVFSVPMMCACQQQEVAQSKRPEPASESTPPKQFYSMVDFGGIPVEVELLPDVALEHALPIKFNAGYVGSSINQDVNGELFSRHIYAIDGREVFIDARKIESESLLNSLDESE